MVLFALCAAIGYGLSDFAGGVAARQVRPRTALWGGELAGALLVIGLLPLWPGTLGWSMLLGAAAAGGAGLLGLGLMYRLMATEPLCVVSPLTSVLAAATPLGYGVATGDRPGPLAWLGVAAALAAVLLIGGEGGARVRPGLVLFALAAGFGFGGYFVLLAHTAHVGGMSSLLATRVTSLALLAPLVIRARSLAAGRTPRVASQWTPLAAVLAAGIADAGADACFLLATRSGYLSVAGVLTSLYPAVTVLLAVTVLRERAGWRSSTGLGLSVLSLALIAT